MLALMFLCSPFEHHLAPPPRAFCPLAVQSEDTTDPNRTSSSRAAPPSETTRIYQPCGSPPMQVNRGANGNPIVSVQREPQLVLLQPLDVGGTTVWGLSSISFWYHRGVVEQLTRSTINKKLVAWAWVVEGVSAVLVFGFIIESVFGYQRHLRSMRSFTLNFCFISPLRPGLEIKNKGLQTTKRQQDHDSLWLQHLVVFRISCT